MDSMHRLSVYPQIHMEVQTFWYGAAGSASGLHLQKKKHLLAAKAIFRVHLPRWQMRLVVSAIDGPRTLMMELCISLLAKLK